MKRLWLFVALFTLFFSACACSSSLSVNRTFGATAEKQPLEQMSRNIPTGMVPIPPGEFMMGSPSNEGTKSEHPQHRVYVDAFYMDKYEVTVGQYKEFLRATGYDELPDYVSQYSPTDDCPVVGVSWDDAQAYAGWAGKRLPTEAEWEYACRAGSTGKFFFGDDESSLSEYAWYSSNSGNRTHPVGEKKPNAWGLYDMNGNVWEYCSDWYYHDYYSHSPLINPKGPLPGQYREFLVLEWIDPVNSRVVRGGCWLDRAGRMRAAWRGSWGQPDFKSYFVGFRCAQDSN